MSSQISWLVEERVMEVSIETVLRGYAADQLLQNMKSMMETCRNKRRRLHLILDISKMQVSHINAELLYNALTPLMVDQQVRWIVLYGASKELQSIFKEVMFSLFSNPCVVLDNRDCAVDFLYRKDRHLPNLMQVAS